MWHWLAAPCLVLSLSELALAQQPSPEEIVKGIYAGGGAKSSIDRLRAPDARKRYFQPVLVRLFDANDREECIDFGLHISGQDYDEKEIARTLRIEAKLDGDRAVVAVRFRNFGKPNQFRYDLERSGDAWKIADIASEAADSRWRLSSVRCGNVRGAPASAVAPSDAPGAKTLAAFRLSGRYCFANRSSQLTVAVDSAGIAEIRVDYSSSGPQSHVCAVEGRATSTADGWRIVMQGTSGLCRLDLAVAGTSRLTARDPDRACKLNFCGERADIAEWALDLRRDRRRCRD